ncbi:MULTISPECIES: hypothetical protein [unclassified Streptomyces]|nr:hypothetical protein [Streptomyces sp. NBC_01549]
MFVVDEGDVGQRAKSSQRPDAVLRIQVQCIRRQLHSGDPVVFGGVLARPGGRHTAMTSRAGPSAATLDRLTGAEVVDVAERRDLEPAVLVTMVGAVAGAVPEWDLCPR